MWAKMAAGKGNAKPAPHPKPTQSTQPTSTGTPAAPVTTATSHRKAPSADLDGLTHQIRYLCTSLRGRMAVVELNDGEKYEGVILHVSGSPLSFELGYSQRLPTDEQKRQASKAARAPRNTNKFEQRQTFVGTRVKRVTVSEKDGPSLLSSGTFRTDRQISNRKPGNPRQLQRWDSDEPVETGGLEEQGGAQGWDQFEANAALGVKDDFNFAEYSTPLDVNSEHFKKHVGKAEAIAASIQGKRPANVHAAMDRGFTVEGINEEALFSQVDPDGDAYRIPARRSDDQPKQAKPQAPATGGTAPSAAVPTAKGVWAQRQQQQHHSSEPHPNKQQQKNGSQPKNSPQATTSAAAGTGPKQPSAKPIKSKLNPNAKAFTLNPNAKSFTPGPAPVPAPGPMPAVPQGVGWIPGPMPPHMIHRFHPQQMMPGFPPHMMPAGGPPPYMYGPGRMAPMGPRIAPIPHRPHSSPPPGP